MSGSSSARAEVKAWASISSLASALPSSAPVQGCLDGGGWEREKANCFVLFGGATHHQSQVSIFRIFKLLSLKIHYNQFRE